MKKTRLIPDDTATAFPSCTNADGPRRTHPDPHETVSEDDPGQQEDEGFVTAEECRHVCRVDLPERLQVQVVGEDPQEAEGRHLGEEHLGCQPVVPEKPTTLPAHKENTQRTQGPQSKYT